MKNLCWLVLPLFLLSFYTLKKNQYSWRYTSSEKLSERIPLKSNYNRVDVASGSFGSWLRELPIKPKGSSIRLYNGKKKWYQILNAGVLDIDVGKRDLQQCADAVIRLRAEYLYSIGRYDKIHFNLTNGMMVAFNKWRKGYRVSVKRNKTSWYRKYQNTDNSYKNFKAYLNFVFVYAGTYSLKKEMKKKSFEDAKIGDVFIKGGFPGHVIMIVDIAEHSKSKKKQYLFAQGYMPAQSIHLIKNQFRPMLGAWFTEKQIRGGFSTTEWSYTLEDFRTW